MDENTSGGNAAGVALRAEMKDIATNPENPLNAGYRRGDPAVMKQIEAKYAAVHGTGKVQLDAGIEVGGAVPTQANETPAEAEERARTDYINGLLRTDWGPEYENNFTAAGTVARTLFGGLEIPFREMSSRVRMEFGPKGEAAAVKFLAELAKIKQGG